MHACTLSQALDNGTEPCALRMSSDTIISQFNAMLKFGTFLFAFVLSLFFFSIVVLIGLLTNGLFKISILPAMYKVWFYILKDL